MADDGVDLDPRNGMQILGEDDCWALLEATDLGRLAVAPAGVPDIFPVNYLARNRRLLFKTGEGTKLASVVVNGAVAFEIDGWDEATNQAWSVVIKGTARTVDDDYEAAALEGEPLFPWNTTPKFNFVEIQPTQLTGRRFVAEGRR